MCPRPYRLGRRLAAGEKTRAQIVAAARKVLMAPEGPAAFSIDAVAHEAGVSRMTVYYRFESRRGLLEALFDDLAARGRMDRLAGAFRHADPVEALSEFIGVFTGFWASGRLLIRRLHGMGTMDPELGRALRAREERRRHGLDVLVRRIAERRSLPPSMTPEDVVDLLFALTSFETFDALVSGKRRPRDVAALIRRLATFVALGETSRIS
ncbi:MAG TPA: TetR/AcrR family transcriptional regulator [Thermoanaerobaculia bacterium]|nr:TetR/AcrR family transcriptional regulator [Thermoanaerobaculia bacterium]